MTTPDRHDTPRRYLANRRANLAPPRTGLLPAIARGGLPQLDIVHHCDALTLLHDLPDGCIDLIATDPPYMGVKDEEWDNQWATEAEYIAWIGDLCKAWRRVLKPNGSLYVFASPRMAARVEVKIGESFNVLNSISWDKANGNRNWSADKEAVRSFLPNTERIIFAEQFASDGKYENQDWLLHSSIFKPLKDWFRQRAGAHKITLNMLNVALGTATGGGGMASHYFGDGKNFELPTVEMYQMMQAVFSEAFNRDYMDLRREYEDLRREYEDLRRPFNLTAYDQYTDVWRFDTVQAYLGKHTCEKPLSLMKHIINVSSKPGGVVLDCFAGSGATLDAARQLGRHYIGNDFDLHWVNYARRRISHAFTLPMFETLGIPA